VVTTAPAKRHTTGTWTPARSGITSAMTFDRWLAIDRAPACGW
jgi:hypothetical protein